MIEAMLVKMLVTSIFDAVTDDGNDLLPDQMKQFVKNNIGDNEEAKQALSKVVNELGKRI